MAIKIAVITAYGLDKGGTEKFLQTVAANLPKDRYKVDYYYIDTDPVRVSDTKKAYLIENNVHLKPYSCDKCMEKYRYIQQVNSNFFNVFTNDYDLILTGSCGLPEEPLTKIKKIPIVQTIHYVSGFDNQYNIARTLHISEFSRDMWIKKGGDKNRVEMISHPINIPKFINLNIRERFGISQECFVYGLHQRDNDYIYSDIPLRAYKEIESEENAFIVCGGSKKYQEQAQKLGIKNCYFIPSTDQNDTIYSFLSALNVYAHGRFDGELNSTALAEAMGFGLPIVSHPSSKFNGHLEVVQDNGFVANDYLEYANYMHQLERENSVWNECSKAAYQMFYNKYDMTVQMQNLMDIFDDVLKNPYTHKFNRTIRAGSSMIGNVLKKTCISLTKE